MFNTIKVNSTDTDYTHSIFDISDYNSSATYDDLSAALAAILESKLHGSMTVCYVLTSDNNYVRYSLLTKDFSLNNEDWTCEQLEIKDINKTVNGTPNPKLTDVINGYLNSNGSWNSDSLYQSLILDIRNYRGQSITVYSPLGTKQYAFLKTFNIESTSEYCSGCSRVSGYPTNETIPNDCNYIYLMVKNNSIGTINAIIPEISISNSSKGLVEKVEKNTSDAIISGERLGKIELDINGNTFNQPSLEDVISGNANSTGVWLESNSTKSLILDISAYKGHKITVSSSITSKQYAFLKRVEPSVCWFCEGCSRVLDYPTNEIIPNDCNFIYLLVKNSDVTKPIIPTISISDTNNLGAIRKIDNISNEIYGMTFNQPTSDDIINGNLYSNGNWESTANTESIVIDVSQFRGHKITALSNISTKQYAFLKTIDVEGTSEYCSGCSRVSDYPINEVIPNDCNYIYLLVGVNSEQTIPIILISDIDGIKPFVNNLKKRVFVSFDSSNQKFTIYQRLYNTVFYTMLEIVNDKDLSDLQYVNIWRLKTNGGLYKRNDNDSFESLNLRLLVTSENEFTVKYRNTSDFTGGYHGDERIDIDPSCYVHFYMDGVIITNEKMQSSFTDWCENFYYEQRSTLHETSATSGQFVAGHPVFAYHLKITSFVDGGYNSVNRLDIDLTNSNFNELQTYSLFTGLVCVHKDAATVVSVDTGNCIETSGNNVTYKFDGNDYPLSVTLDYKGYNTNTGLSSHVTSMELTKPSSGHNTLSIWDRTSDTKYYGYAPNRTFVTGDIYVSEIKVRWAYKTIQLL